MAHERTKSGGGAKETAKDSADPKKGEINLDALFNDLEGKARGYLAGAEKWIGQGDEVLSKAKTWLEEHPVAVALAAKYGRKVTFVPRSSDELREAATKATKRARKSTSRAVAVVRENPMEMAVVGLALGTIAWAAMRTSRA